MEMVNFLNNLATHAYHRVDMDEMLSKLSPALKQAYLQNDIESVKSQLSNDGYLANESHVVQV